MCEVIKSGNLFKFSDTVFNSKWKYNYVELLQNSSLRWFENKGDRAAKRSVVLKDVASFLAFGDVVRQLPFKPEVKDEQINLLIAIPHDSNRNTRLTFFLCNNQAEMQEWVNSILKTISDPSNSQRLTNNEITNTYTTSSTAPTCGSSNIYPTGSQNMNAPFNAGPSNVAGTYPGGPSNMSNSYPGGPPNAGVGYHGALPPYQGAPPPYSGGPSSGPPPIGFNFGGPSAGQYQQGQQNYPYPSYPQNPPVAPTSSYQAGYNPYPTQPMQYSAGAPRPMQYGAGAPQPVQYVAGGSQGYMPGNPPVAYANQQPAQTYVIVDGKKRKKKSKLKNAAIGLAAGAAGAYATHKLFGGHGHGWGGGWGGHHGYGGGWGGHHWGSWSSLSSFDSYGSFSD